MPLRFRYLLAMAILFVVEIAIALFVHDRIVRPHVGDTLAVMLAYCGLRGVMSLRIGPAVAIALAIAAGIEIGQWLRLVDRLGLGGYPVAKVILGTGFDPRDFLAYTVGGASVLLAEAVRQRRR